MSHTPYYLTREGQAFYALARTALTSGLRELQRLNTNLEALVVAIRELAAARRDA